jgi:hypothetical protein
MVTANSPSLNINEDRVAVLSASTIPVLEMDSLGIN